MKHFFASIKLKHYLTLVSLIIIGFGWLLVDQIFLQEVYQRFIAFIVLMLVLYFLQFLINKPVQVIKYANTLAIITVSFIVIVSVIIDVIVKHNFTYKSILIWIVTALMPYLGGLIYMFVRRK
jgi:hypothetical protein